MTVIISDLMKEQKQTSVIQEALAIMRLIRRHVEEERSHKNCCCRKIIRGLEARQSPKARVSYAPPLRHPLADDNLNDFAQ